MPNPHAEYLTISLSSTTFSLQRSFNLLGGISCQFISILHSKFNTPWLARKYASLEFRVEDLKFVV